MSVVNTCTGGGGAKVNGIIRQYRIAEGNNISARGFVKFVNELTGAMMPEQITAISTFTASHQSVSINALQLDERRVFIAYAKANSDGALYGLVITINGAEISIGPDQEIANLAYAGASIELLLLDANRVFIAHNGVASYYYAHATVAVIDGTTISHGEYRTISTRNDSAESTFPLKLDDRRVLVAYKGERTQWCLYARVLTIEGTEITVGPEYTLSDTTYSGLAVGMVQLDSERVFMAYSGSYFLYGMVLTVKGTAIAQGTMYYIDTSSYSGMRLSVAKLDAKRIFIAHSKGNGPDDYILYGIVASVDGATIRHGVDTLLSTERYTGVRVRTVLLDDERIAVIHGTGDYRYLCVMVVSVTGLEVTTGTDTQLNEMNSTGDHFGACTLDSEHVYIAHKDSNSYLRLTAVSVSGIGPAHKGDSLLGVAKAGGAPGKVIQVYRPTDEGDGA